MELSISCGICVNNSISRGHPPCRRCAGKFQADCLGRKPVLAACLFFYGSAADSLRIDAAPVKFRAHTPT